MAIAAWLCAVDSPRRIRIETVLDAARGMFAQRQATPEMADWAIRLCSYISSEHQSFEPRWKAVALLVEMHHQLGLHDKSLEAFLQLEQYPITGTYGHEVSFVCDRLRRIIRPDSGVIR